MPQPETDIITPMDLSRQVDNEFVGHPNMSVADFTQFAELMIFDDATPKDAKPSFWGFLDKEAVISNIKRDEIPRIMNRLAITEMTEIMSKPFGWFSWEEQQKQDNIEHKVWLKASRSVDAGERRLLATQIKQIDTNRGEAQKKIGLIQKIFSFGKGDKK